MPLLVMADGSGAGTGGLTADGGRKIGFSDPIAR
jgi:hypothetical protein